MDTRPTIGNLSWKLRQVMRLFEVLLLSPLLLWPCRKSTAAPATDIEPIWVIGMYRSGTSIATRILAALGGDLGPAHHLMQPVGWYRKLNPAGFFENYLFEDVARYQLHRAGGSGDAPPEPAAVSGLDWNIGRWKFLYHTVFKFHDERISKWNRARILLSYCGSNLSYYLRSQFSSRPVIKNGHLTFLVDPLSKQWPNSNFVGVFRHPSTVMASAGAMEADTTEALWISYNTILRDLAKEGKCTLVPFEQLLSNPEPLVARVAEGTGLGLGQVQRAATLVDESSVEHSMLRPVSDSAQALYNELMELAQ